MRKTFWFNTGVKMGMNTPYGCQQWRGGTIQIPFICENVPENAIFKSASDTKGENSFEILNHGEKGALCSKYAHFFIPS